MQKSIFSALVLMFIIPMCFAQSFPSASYSQITITPKIGYSTSNTRFNIAGNEMGTNPNILSELIWEPTNNIEVGLEATLGHKQFYLRSSVDINSTFSGNVSDIDYNGDNRTAPYSQSRLSNHKGTGYHIAIQPGYYWQRSQQLSLATYLSVKYGSKTLSLLNGKNWTPNQSNYIAGLNSYYKYKFPSLGAGAVLIYDLNRDWTMGGNVAMHWAKYYAYGNWNVKQELMKPISYEHKGNGMDLSTNVNIDRRLSESTSLGLAYNFNTFFVYNGKDYAYSRTNGTLRTKLNEVKEIKHGFLLQFKVRLPIY